MEMNKFFLIFLLAFLHRAASHSYHMGDCPTVEPVKLFDMPKFLGVWYVIEKTSTSSWCYTYNFTQGEEHGTYIMHKSGENGLLGSRHASLSGRFNYKGVLKVPDHETPGKMKVKFPMNPIGEYPLIVFATDYDTYGGVYTCQKLPLSNRRSASILSRTPSLDKETIQELHSKLHSQGIDTKELKLIDHSKCPSGTDFIPSDIR